MELSTVWLAVVKMNQMIGAKSSKELGAPLSPRSKGSSLTDGYRIALVFADTWLRTPVFGAANADALQSVYTESSISTM